MNMKRVALLIAGVTLGSFMMIGCGDTTNRNGNTNTNANANTARAEANANRGDGRSNSNMSREDFDRQKDTFARQARDLGRTIGSGADDLWIWTKVRSALAAADDLRDSTVNVDVDNNAVTLTGSVASAAQKARAAEVARGVEGVRNVVDRLQVSSGNANGNANRR